MEQCPQPHQLTKQQNASCRQDTMPISTAEAVPTRCGEVVCRQFPTRCGEVRLTRQLGLLRQLLFVILLFSSCQGCSAQLEMIGRLSENLYETVTGKSNKKIGSVVSSSMRRAWGRVPWGLIAFGLIGGLTLCFLLVVGWYYLCRRMHCKQLRSIMMFAVSALTICELVIYSLGYMKRWVIFAIVFGNIWGPLDAVLRYPIVHDLDSLFTVKVWLVWCARLFATIFGFIPKFFNPWLFAMTAICHVLLPVMFLVALPLEKNPKEQRQLATGIVDVDVAVRLGQCLFDPQEREACIKRLRRAVLTISRRFASKPLPF